MTSGADNRRTRREIIRLSWQALAGIAVGACTATEATSPELTRLVDTTQPTASSATLGSLDTTETTATTSTATPPPTTAPARIVDVVCRADWGAREPTAGLEAHVIDRLTIHHTAAIIADPADGAPRARDHQRYHQSLGWPDLAYHFLIGPDGVVREGRSVAFRGDTATDYDPAGHLLICMEGDFNQQQLPEPQFDALIAMTAWGCQTYGIDPTTVLGHRDVASTSCPGDAVAAVIEDGTVASLVAAQPLVQAPVICT